MGDLLAAFGAVSVAVYLLYGRSLRRKLSLFPYVAICYSSVAVILWLGVLFLNLSMTGYSMQTVAAFWAMALTSQLIGHSSYNWPLKWFSTSFSGSVFAGRTDRQHPAGFHYIRRRTDLDEI